MLSSPDVHVFAELLDLPNVQKVGLPSFVWGFFGLEPPPAGVPKWPWASHLEETLPHRCFDVTLLAFGPRSYTGSRLTASRHSSTYPRTLPQLRGTGQEPSLALLELFAYGSYPEYKAAAASLPKLNPQQLKKLR